MYYGIDEVILLKYFFLNAFVNHVLNARSNIHFCELGVVGIGIGSVR